MPVCPYGTHRLVLEGAGSCRHCGGDLRLYAALCDLPAALYNQARRLWDEGQPAAAAGWLQAALALRDDLAEAHWLLGAVEDRLGRPQSAHRHLARAQELGAPADPAWVDVPLDGLV